MFRVENNDDHNARLRRSEQRAEGEDLLTRLALERADAEWRIIPILDRLIERADALRPDGGSILRDERKVAIASIRDALSDLVHTVRSELDDYAECAGRWEVES